MKMISFLMHILKWIAYGVWAIVEFIGAFIYYIFTEIFIDPFIIIKPIKIAAKWLYDNCNRFPIVSLYFTYFVRPQSQNRTVQWLSQTPWAVAMPPVAVVALTSLIKLFAISLAASHPVLAAVIFIGDKITLVPIALRMWDEVRPVVRQDTILRQIDNVVNFLFHVLPVRAKDIVVTRMRALKAFIAPVMDPIRARLRVLTQPLRDLLRPFGARLKAVLKAWAARARDLLLRIFVGRRQPAKPGRAAKRHDVKPTATPSKGMKHRPLARMRRPRKKH